MRVVALEEHFTVPALVRRIDPGAISRRGPVWPVPAARSVVLRRSMVGKCEWVMGRL